MTGILHCPLKDLKQSEAYVYRQCRGQSQLPQTCQHVALSQPGKQQGTYNDWLLIDCLISFWPS